MKTMLLYQQEGQDQVAAFDLDLIWNALYGLFSTFLSRLPYIAFAIIAFAFFLLASKIVSQTINAAGRRTRLDITLANLLGRLSSFLMIVLGILVAAVIIFPAFKPGDLVAGLGITSVAIGFAFKDVLQNFFAGILILWRKPFVVGDQLQFKEFEGTVEEITVRSTRIKTFEGERAVIPNGDIYANPVLVKTAYENRRVKFTVGIGYLDDIESGRKAIATVLRNTPGVLRDPDPLILVSELAPSSVNFIIYFWVESKQSQVSHVSDRVVTGIRYALDDAGIDIPYPHRVVLFHDVTGTKYGDINRASHSAMRPAAKHERRDY